MEIPKQFSRRLFSALLVAGGMAVGVAAASPATSAWTAAPPTNMGAAAASPTTGTWTAAPTTGARTAAPPTNSGAAAASPAIRAWTTAPPADTWVAVPPADTGRYGSGTLDSWAGYSERISTHQIIRAVVAQDGILAFGDSIGVSTFADLATRLYSSGTQLAMNAKSGRPTAPTVDILSRWATLYHLPTRILMAVGTNDIFNPPGFAAQINRVMTITGPDVVVYWPEIHVSRLEQSAGVQVADQRNSDWLNVQLHAAAARHPNLRIISWASFLNQKPGSRIAAYLSDGVHPTATGMAARNLLISQQIQLPSVTPTPAR